MWLRAGEPLLGQAGAVAHLNKAAIENKRTAARTLGDFERAEWLLRSDIATVADRKRSPGRRRRGGASLGCLSGRLLKTEAVPPAYPVMHEYLPDSDGFYGDWLGRDLP